MNEAVLHAAQGTAGPEARLRQLLTDAELGGLPGTITVEMLRATFDQWTIGETAGRFLAIRTGCFAATGPASLIRGCVIADTPEGLAEQLGIQAWLQSLSAAKLEAAWRSGPAAVLS
jgi:hypothetical protein